jgi:hypothetical protein
MYETKGTNVTDRTTPPCLTDYTDPCSQSRVSADRDESGAKSRKGSLRPKPGHKLDRLEYLDALDKALANARGQRVVNTGIKRQGETVDEFRRRMRVEWKGRMR